MSEEPVVESRTMTIKASAEVCYEVICDFEAYPKWQKVISYAKVIKNDDNGRPKVVEYKAGLLLKKVRYVLDYTYDDENNTLVWSYVEGDLEDIRGSAVFKSRGPREAEATYSFAVTPGFTVPKRLLSYATDKALGAGLKEFRKQAEKVAKKKR